MNIDEFKAKQDSDFQLFKEWWTFNKKYKSGFSDSMSLKEWRASYSLFVKEYEEYQGEKNNARR